MKMRMEPMPSTKLSVSYLRYSKFFEKGGVGVKPISTMSVSGK